MTTLLSRRTQRTVVERIRRRVGAWAALFLGAATDGFFFMSAILDYSSENLWHIRIHEDKGAVPSLLRDALDFRHFAASQVIPWKKWGALRKSAGCADSISCDQHRDAGALVLSSSEVGTLCRVGRAFLPALNFLQPRATHIL